MPARRPLLAFLLACLSALAGAGAAPGADPPRAYPRYLPDTTATVVYLVRHAEKNPHPAGGDSGLSEPGLRRAAALAHVLGDAGVTRCYVSQFGRSQRTAVPLARALGDSVRVYDANRLEDLAQTILVEDRGRAVLVVGHSDTVPQTIEALTGSPLDPSLSIDYDMLFVACLFADGSSRLLRLRYGERLQ